jgi:hypothetical protein
MISSRDAITALVSSNGDAKLAAVRVSRELGVTVTEPLLLSAIAADPNAPNILYRQIQLLMALQAFDTFRKVQMTFVEKLPSMSPDVVSRTYLGMLQELGHITSLGGSAPAGDPIRAVLQSLPPEIADAVERLMQSSGMDQESTMQALQNPSLPEGNDPDSAEVGAPGVKQLEEVAA